MNPREKRMAIVLGVLLVVAMVAGGYMLIYDPWVTKKAQIAAAKQEINDKTDKNFYYQKLAKQIKQYKDKSLTSDPALARRGYDFLLNDLIAKAGISSGNSTVTPGAESKSATVPLLNDNPSGSMSSSPKDKPAYVRVPTRITLSRVDLRMLGEFLRLYYNTPVLQHITSIKIQTKAEAGGGTQRRIRDDKTDPEQWKDLEVTIMTEAMVLDGVDARKTLAAIPEANIAAFGTAVFRTLQTRSDLGSQILISQAKNNANSTNSMLNSREYDVLMAKDIFHGPLPPPPPKPETPRPAPKANIDRFIKLNEITRRSDGSAKIEIRDQANNFAYTAEMTPKGERTEFKFVRTWYSPSGKPIREQLGKELNIADEKTSSQYKFKVVAVDSVEGIVLSGPPIGNGSGSSSQGSGSGGGSGGRNGGGFNRGGSMSSRLPAPKAYAALIGGLYASQPDAAETLYYLKNGMSIEKMKKINAAEVIEIIKRNTALGLNPFVNTEIALPAVEPVAELSGDEK